MFLQLLLLIRGELEKVGSQQPPSFLYQGRTPNPVSGEPGRISNLFSSPTKFPATPGERHTRCGTAATPSGPGHNSSHSGTLRFPGVGLRTSYRRRPTSSSNLLYALSIASLREQRTSLVFVFVSPQPTAQPPDKTRCCMRLLVLYVTLSY